VPVDVDLLPLFAESRRQEATCIAGPADIAGAGSHLQFGQWTRYEDVLIPAQIPA
jgi:hypothetical protein